MDLEDYDIIQEDTDFILLQNKCNNMTYVYKEYEIPKFIGMKQILPTQQLIECLENRKCLFGPNIIHLTDYTLTSKLCLIYEFQLKNFDEELSKRRNTTQFWSEEELYNTFQACLASLKTYHDVFIYTIQCEIVHGSICPKSIIFSQDQQVKLADHFVISTDFKQNWKNEPDREEYGFWAPEVVNVYDGWKYKFETIENDIWSLGIVFLEAMSLKSGFDYYFLDDSNRLYIDFQLINDAINNLRKQYSQEIIGLIQIMLAIDPIERTWDRLINQNAKIQDSANAKISIHPIMEESEEDSQVEQTHRTEEIIEQSNTDKNRLLGMLESCLLKSRQLISENESRKSKRPSCENVVQSQSSPSKDDVNSSLLMLMKGKHSKKNSTDSNASVLKEIPQNKQRKRQQREYLKQIHLINTNEKDPGNFDPNNLSNIEEQYRCYSGEGKNNKMHGNGQLTFKNGAILQGSFLDGNINGYGILLINGEMIVGNWKNNILVQVM